MKCIEAVKKKTVHTQHIILLKHIIESLSERPNLILKSEFDSMADKIYGEVREFTLRMVEEFMKRVKDKELTEDHFVEEQIYTSRIQLIMMLIFKGKIRSDSKVSFQLLLKFLTSTEDENQHLQRLLDVIINEPIINKDNSKIFFGIFNSEDKTLKPSQIDMRIYKVFETLFYKINLDVGALRNYTKKYYAIAKHDKMVHLKNLWNICLKIMIKKEVKEKFYELLISCYFMCESKFEGEAAYNSWLLFIRDAKDYLEVRKISENESNFSLFLTFYSLTNWVENQNSN